MTLVIIFADGSKRSTDGVFWFKRGSRFSYVPKEHVMFFGEANDFEQVL